MGFMGLRVEGSQGGFLGLGRLGFWGLESFESFFSLEVEGGEFLGFGFRSLQASGKLTEPLQLWFIEVAVT